MQGRTDENHWQVACCSIRGDSHIRNGLPNQDAIATVENKEAGFLALAVADGHGSSKSFRSERGSKAAVDIALSVLSELANLNNESFAPDSFAVESLPSVIEKKWRDHVISDFTSDPFTEQELSKLEDKEGEKARTNALANPLYAYGTTLLSALITREYLLLMQIGDGDILLVNDKGDVFYPIPHDELLIANETTSLCDPNARLNFSVKVLPLQPEAPRVVVLATDGYSNSYQTQQDFDYIGRDYLKMIFFKGLEKVEKSLDQILKQVSKFGSGDDISLGFIYRKKEEPVGPIVGGMHSDHFWTITEAIQRSPAGSRIHVKPGTYNESILIDSDVEIVGDGPREFIIIQSTSGSCFEHKAGKAMLSNLTVQSTASGTEKPSFGIHSSGGEMLIDNCAIQSRSFPALAVSKKADVSCCRLSVKADKDAALVLSEQGQCHMTDSKLVSSSTSTVLLVNRSTAQFTNCEILHEGKELSLLIKDGAHVDMNNCLLLSGSDKTVLLEGGTLAADKTEFFAASEAGIIILNANCELNNCRIIANGKAGLAYSKDSEPRVRDTLIINSSKGYYLLDENTPIEDALKIYESSS